MCAKVIVNYIKSLDLDIMYSNKNYIHDISFYQLVNSFDLSKVNIDLIVEEEQIDKLINLTNEKENEEENENEDKKEEEEEEEEKPKPKKALNKKQFL